MKIHDFELWADHHLTSNTSRIINCWGIIILGVWKDIFRFQTFHFSKKNLSLSVSHENTLILTKNDVFYGNFVGNRQTKKNLWKTDKVGMEVSHTFPISMGDQKKKSYGLLKFSAKGGGSQLRLRVWKKTRTFHSEIICICLYEKWMSIASLNVPNFKTLFFWKFPY